MRRVRFIVHADDLGMSAAANAAIEQCLAARTITSASILANGPEFEDGISIAKRHPSASYGVHLNITEFSPLSGANLEDLVRDGVFVNAARTARLSRHLIAGAREEFSAQIERVQQSGVAISHLDSHHHIHTVPGLFLVVVGLAKRHGIRYVRQSRNIFPRDNPAAKSLQLKKAAWNAALGLAGLRRTDYFGSLTDFERTGLRFAHGSRIEIMVHPGGAGFEAESARLDTAWWEGHGIAPVWETYAGPV